MTKSHIYFLLFEENSKCVKKHIPRKRLLG